MKNIEADTSMRTSLGGNNNTTPEI
jgi:hypothetical protein